MAGMTPEEAENFYEEDEDPTELFAAYDAARENSAKSPVVLEETGGLVRSPDTAGGPLKLSLSPVPAASIDIHAVGI